LKTARDLFFILVIVSLIFAGCGDDSDYQTERPPEEVDQELNQFSMVRMLEGRTKWKLNADAATFLESDRVKIEKVELLIFGDKGDETMTIHGEQGEVNQRTKNIKIMGNVIGIASDGSRLNTEELYWRDRAEKLYTLPGVKVTITYEDSVIVGEELEASPELETAELKNVTGISRSEEKESE